MTTILELIRENLLEKIHKFYSGEFPSGTEILSLKVDINQLASGFDLNKEKIYVWFLSQDKEEKFFWADKENSYYMAGLSVFSVYRNFPREDLQGVIRHLYTLSEKHQEIRKYPLRFWGTMDFSFFHDAPHGEYGEGLSGLWEDYPRIIFFLPRIVLVKNRDHFSLELFLSPGDTESYAKGLVDSLRWEYDEKRFRELNEASLGTFTREYITSRNEWSRLMDNSMKALASPSDLQKVVLARALKLTFDSAIDPISIFYRLTKNRPQSVRFYFQFKKNHAFMGATPERLYARNGSMLRTEAIAGTRSRGEKPEKDILLQKELMESLKDSREHLLVIQSIEESLSPLCNDMEIQETRILELRNVMHLQTPIQCHIRENIYDDDLLQAMHPTAAIGGYPREDAVSFINKNEDFPRGWYASPIGWLEHGESEFNVAIRSGLLREKNLYLFGGAGIIQESKEQEEWSEIENKINSFLDSITEVFS